MVLGLRHSQTPALPDFETPALPDSETSGLPGSLRGSEAPGGHLMNMNMNFANNVEMSEDEIEHVTRTWMILAAYVEIRDELN